MSDFLAEMAPKMNPACRRFLAEFVFTAIASLAEEATIRPLSMAEIRQWAASSADMVLSYLAAPAALLPGGTRRPPTRAA